MRKATSLFLKNPAVGCNSAAWVACDVDIKSSSVTSMSSVIGRLGYPDVREEELDESETLLLLFGSMLETWLLISSDSLEDDVLATRWGRDGFFAGRRQVCSSATVLHRRASFLVRAMPILEQEVTSSSAVSSSPPSSVKESQRRTSSRLIPRTPTIAVISFSDMGCLNADAMVIGRKPGLASLGGFLSSLSTTPATASWGFRWEEGSAHLSAAGPRILKIRRKCDGEDASLCNE